MREECDELRLLDNENEEFCSQHACFVCRHEMIHPARLAREEPPRNSCKIHPLCLATVEDEFCMNLAVENSPFCEMHAGVRCKAAGCTAFAISRSEPFCLGHQPLLRAALENQRCQGITKKRKPCKGQRLPYSHYCKDHQDQEVVVEKDLPGGEVGGSCMALTKQGHPCKDKARPGEPYCFNHRNNPPLLDVSKFPNFERKEKGEEERKEEETKEEKKEPPEFC